MVGLNIFVIYFKIAIAQLLGNWEFSRNPGALGMRTRSETETSSANINLRISITNKWQETLFVRTLNRNALGCISTRSWPDQEFWPDPDWISILNTGPGPDPDQQNWPDFGPDRTEPDRTGPDSGLLLISTQLKCTSLLYQHTFGDLYDVPDVRGLL